MSVLSQVKSPSKPKKNPELLSPQKPQNLVNLGIITFGHWQLSHLYDLSKSQPKGYAGNLYIFFVEEMHLKTRGIQTDFIGWLKIIDVFVTLAAIKTVNINYVIFNEGSLIL